VRRSRRRTWPTRRRRLHLAPSASTASETTTFHLCLSTSGHSPSLHLARYLWNLSLAFGVNPRSRSSWRGHEVSRRGRCCRQPLRTGALPDTRHGGSGECCSSASNVSTTTCLPTSVRRTCFLLIATQTRRSLSSRINGALWKCPDCRARLVVIVVAVADQSASLPSARCRRAGGAIMLGNQSATGDGTFDLRRRRRRRRRCIVVCLPVCDFATPRR